MVKSLDRKLAAIHADPSGSREFILADAKDADMAFGIGAPGQSPEAHAGEVRFKTLEEYREQIRAIVHQGVVDIMLMSAHTNHALTIRERLFENSAITPPPGPTTPPTSTSPGGRATPRAPPGRSGRPASTISSAATSIARPTSGPWAPTSGLYSVTFNNDLALDLATLERFREFREEAERKRFRYFLEVFDPNVPGVIDPAILPGYLNDMIARMLAGVAPAGRPTFLKIVYHGPRAMEELVRYDPTWSSASSAARPGTTRDAFQLLADAQKYGAKVALYGRKINNAENQLAFIQFLRLIVDGVIGPVEAVKAYHAVLGKLGIRPHRPIDQDLKVQALAMSYGGTSTQVVVPAMPAKAEGCGCHAKEAATPAGRRPRLQVPRAGGDGRPTARCRPRSPRPTASPASSTGCRTSARMDVGQRLAYHRQRLGLGR